MRLRLLVCLVLSGLGIFALSGPGISAQEPEATIRAEVALVNVYFSATDRGGRPIQGLKAEDFQIFENKVPQKIEYFSSLGSSSEVPLTIALLIDTSGSVKDKLDYEKATAAEFFKEILRPNKDLALIMQFDSEVNLVQDFTQDQKLLIRSLNSLKAGNSTSLYDAVYLAAEERLRREVGRKVMIVISDGADTSSKVKEHEAIDSAQKSDALVYGMGVRSDGYQTDFDVLERFAKETGGRFFSPRASFKEIQAAFRSIGEEIKGQYSLAYVSTNKAKDGSFRPLDLRCKVGGVKIRARKGYYAPKS